MWELDLKESWAQKNWCIWTVILEKTLESPLKCKESQPIHPKGNQPWMFTGRTDAETEGLMLKLKLQYFGHLVGRDGSSERPWCWERLRAGGEGSDRGWDGWMASPAQWTWVWVNSRSWWRTGKPCVLPSIGSQRVWDDWATQLNIPLYIHHIFIIQMDNS